MLALVAQAGAVATTNSTVLLTGESGVGKDVLARYIHFRSARTALPMMSVNCAAITETLFESEFFGYEKGAFTGATATRPGLLEAADESTLFLDEVGDLTPAMQVKLLRFLEDGTFRRVGATSDRRVSVRIIAATNKDLQAAVREQTFRADLYYRLNVISFAVPPLRERREEIPELVESFMAGFRSRFGRPLLSVSPEASRCLQEYNWPGNVRELRNCLERACVLTTADVIEQDDLVVVARGKLGLARRGAAASEGSVVSMAGQLSLAEVERRHILLVLDEQAGNRRRTARILGISERTLQRKLREYGVAAAPSLAARAVA